MDNVMDVLNRARKCELEISAQVEHIERLRRIARTVKGNRVRCEEILDKLALLETEINTQIDKSVDAKKKALDYINELTGEERGVLERYYILAKGWEQVAADMYMSVRAVFLIRKKSTGKNHKEGGKKCTSVNL